jgi:hypothetical protein
VEFKHQNISAVLEELGLPWIPGYKPKRNYQRALLDGIDRYLSVHRDLPYEQPEPAMLVAAEESPVFVRYVARIAARSGPQLPLEDVLAVKPKMGEMGLRLRPPRHSQFAIFSKQPRYGCRQTSACHQDRAVIVD